MADHRLKIKIGDHEFEAEGPVEIVQAQFDAFKELVTTAPPKVITPTPREPEKPHDESGTPQNGNGDAAQLNLDSIMRVSGRVISLTVRAASIPDAALLVMLGQRHFRGTENVTGAQILDGLRESGHPMERIDRVMQPLSTSGDVITIGMHRSKTYRLTNAGMTRAREIARSLIALVA
jgi:hypothetical protein